MKDKLMKFFSGRYGADKLTYYLMYFSLALLIVGQISDKIIISYIAFAIIIYANYRVLSKNISKRSNENRIFLGKTYKIRHFFAKKYYHIFGKDGFKYFTCNTCKSELRIPKNKGKIRVRCPKCNTEYIKRT
ncbi:MAG: hypothetical protein Q4A42_01730 [Tissierellia bacterium]|nr:hypothetical protein [Tissierellia bacterium]